MLLTGSTHPASVNRLGRPFRLACQRARRLADQLTRSLALTLRSGDGREAVQSSQAAFLRRQEGLEVLAIAEGAPDVLRPVERVELFVMMIKTLLQGRDTFRHLHTLKIRTPTAPACSVEAGDAIQLLCPSLRELVVEVRNPGAAFFSPLRICPGLQKISIFGNDTDLLNGGVLRTLAALPALRDLSLSGLMDPTDTPLLAEFTGLRHLRVAALALRGALPSQQAAGGLGSALGRLAQLTELDAPLSNSGGPALNAMVAQLGGLRLLQNLSFGSDSAAPDVLGEAFAAVCRLTALTRLCCPALCPALPAAAGRLPKLRHLHIRGWRSRAALATSVQTLLPLPALREVHCSVSFLPGTGAVDNTGDAAGTHAAAAWQLAASLAQATRPVDIHLGVLGVGQAEQHREGYASVSQAAGIFLALLLPLQHTLTSLTMYFHSAAVFEAVWPVLCLASRLASLVLVKCSMPESRLLLAVGQEMGSLRHLRVMDCSGLPGSSVVALAGVRLQPLCITWTPALTVEERQAFQAAARAGVELDN